MCTGEQGHREGGRGYNDPGAHGLWGPMRLPMGFRKARKGPIKWHLEMSMWDLLFGDHLILAEKTVRIPVKNFFFLRSHHNLDKTAALFPSVLEFTKPEFRHIIQLAPGLRSAVGAPAGERRPSCNTRHLLVLSCFLFHCLIINDVLKTDDVIITACLIWNVTLRHWFPRYFFPNYYHFVGQIKMICWQTGHRPQYSSCAASKTV